VCQHVGNSQSTDRPPPCGMPRGVWAGDDDDEDDEEEEEEEEEEEDECGAHAAHAPSPPG
jgi:ribosomal protein L12E/L44/L45/RPP1/RPP2